MTLKLSFFVCCQHTKYMSKYIQYTIYSTQQYSDFLLLAMTFSQPVASQGESRQTRWQRCGGELADGELAPTGCSSSDVFVCSRLLMCASVCGPLRTCWGVCLSQCTSPGVLTKPWTGLEWTIPSQGHGIWSRLCCGSHGGSVIILAPLIPIHFRCLITAASTGLCSHTFVLCRGRIKTRNNTITSSFAWCWLHLEYLHSSFIDFIK